LFIVGEWFEAFAFLLLKGITYIAPEVGKLMHYDYIQWIHVLRLKIWLPNLLVTHLWVSFSIFFALQFLHLQNGGPASIYLIGLLWECNNVLKFWYPVSGSNTFKSWILFPGPLVVVYTTYSFYIEIGSVSLHSFAFPSVCVLFDLMLAFYHHPKTIMSITLAAGILIHPLWESQANFPQSLLTGNHYITRSF
jgi:hypothetical protein